MRSLRKEDLSLYLYIQDVVLRDFVEVEEFAQLRLMSDLSTDGSYVYEPVVDFEPYPSERGRGWVYFDTPDNEIFCEPFTSVSGINSAGDLIYGIQEQSSRVVVYNDGGDEEVVWQDYMIDYIDGRIIIPYKLNNPVATYTWNYVSVVDEWCVIQASTPPVVAIDVGDISKDGYQIGGGKKSVRSVDIHVFASNAAERNDLVEVLYDGFHNRSCQLFEFSTGSVLDFDGTFNGRRDLEDRVSELNSKNQFLFDATEVSNMSRVYFDSVKARRVSASSITNRGADKMMLSDLNAYRSKITFDMVTYDDRVIN
jgi:hypothetical protein